MFIMSHRDINARVDSGKLYWAKQTLFPDGGCEVAVTRVPELRLRWINNELPRKQKVCPITVEWARGKSKAQIAAEVARFKAIEDEEKRERSLKGAVSRARQKVRFAVKVIGGDHMLTLSYRENMEDVVRLKRDWQEFVRRVRLKHESWQFVAVPEKQERGAYHLHVAVHGRQDIKFLLRCWYQALGGTGNEHGSETPGAINVRGPQKRWRDEGTHGLSWVPNKLSAYMTKYIAKTFEESEKHAKRYWHSKGIKVEQRGFWLASASFQDAVVEIYERIEMRGNFGLDVRARAGEGVIWLSALYRLEEECPF